MISCQDMTVLTSMEADVVEAFAEDYENCVHRCQISYYYYYKVDML